MIWPKAIFFFIVGLILGSFLIAIYKFKSRLVQLSLGFLFMLLLLVVYSGYIVAYLMPDMPPLVMLALQNALIITIVAVLMFSANLD